MKSFHLDAEHPWTEHLEHVGRWATRSDLRGIGPARQSQPIPLKNVMALTSRPEPCVKEGPSHPRQAYLLGSIFLLREVELSATRLEHLAFSKGETTVTWTLSASKTDPMAFGVTRTLGCLCGHSTLPCPFHLALSVARSVRRYAIDYGLTSDEFSALPLFHDGTGHAPTKAGMVLTFEHLAQQCGFPLCSADGARLYGGHSPRVAGAQALASAGAEVAQVRIFARHSGDAILRYVAESPLATMRHDLGKRAASTKGLSDTAAFKTFLAQFQNLAEKVAAQDSAIAALTALSSDRVLVYVQNLHTMKIHGQRAGDSSSTICGMKVGVARIKRGGIRFLNTISGEDWRILCECCLRPELEAAKHLEEKSIGSIADSASKRFLQQ